MAGRQLADVAEDRERRGDRVEREERLERVEVDLALRQRVELRRERQLAADVAVVERLDPEAVARERQPPARARPRPRPRTSRAAAPRARPPFLVAVHEHLGVAAGAEAVTRALELAHQLAVVVDLAVLDDDDRAVLVRDRLVAGSQIDDGEPARGDPDRSVEMSPSESGPRWKRVAAIAREPLGVDGAARRRDSADPAHGGASLGRARRSVWPSTRKPVTNDRAQVEPDRAVGDPLQVVRELLGHRRLVAVPHLREPGQPGRTTRRCQ